MAESSKPQEKYHAAVLDNLSNSHGSALLTSGETIVQASVYGPTNISYWKEQYDKAVIQVFLKAKAGRINLWRKAHETFIKSAIEPVVLTRLHPRRSVKITIQEVQDEGNIVACYINAAYLALLDAGISMDGILSAISIGVFDDEIKPFPSQKEIEKAKSIVTICIKNPSGNLVGIKCTKFLEEDNFKRCVEVAKKSAEDMQKFYKECMKKRWACIEKRGLKPNEEDDETTIEK